MNNICSGALNLPLSESPNENPHSAAAALVKLLRRMQVQDSQLDALYVRVEAMQQVTMRTLNAIEQDFFCSRYKFSTSYRQSCHSSMYKIASREAKIFSCQHRSSQQLNGEVLVSTNYDYKHQHKNLAIRRIDFKDAEMHVRSNCDNFKISDVCSKEMNNFESSDLEQMREHCVALQTERQLEQARLDYKKEQRQSAQFAHLLNCKTSPLEKSFVFMNSSLVPGTSVVAEVRDGSAPRLHPNKPEIKTPDEALQPHMHLRFCRLSALAKGFLTRRLFCSDKVQDIIRTVRDSAQFVLHLQKENQARGSQTLSRSDQLLQNRVILQLRSALFEIHDIIFVDSVQMRMFYIAQSRANRKEVKLNATRISSATVKRRQMRAASTKLKIKATVVQQPLQSLQSRFNCIRLQQPSQISFVRRRISSSSRTSSISTSCTDDIDALPTLRRITSSSRSVVPSVAVAAL